MTWTVKLLASVFYLGYIPIMPGTIGSIAGVAMYLFIHNNVTYLALTTGIFLLGLCVSGPAERIFGKQDSRKIVIDEASGMLFTYLFIPFGRECLFAGFLLFRFFDILKPPPLKRIQKLPGSFGVMLDDVLAAAYSNIILRVVF